MTTRTALVQYRARMVLKQVGTMRQTILRVAPIVVNTGGGASLPIAQSDVTGLVTRLDNIDNALLLKATQAALDALTVIVDSKATADDVAQAIADLLATDTQVLQTLQQFAQALADYDDLLEALEYTVANRVRFDTSAQGLTSLQKANARTNIAAEEIGTAAALIALLSQVASTGDYNHLVNKPLQYRGGSLIDEQSLYVADATATNFPNSVVRVHNDITVPSIYNSAGAVFFLELDVVGLPFGTQDGYWQLYVNNNAIAISGQTSFGSQHPTLYRLFLVMIRTASDYRCSLYTGISGAAVISTTISGANLPALGAQFIVNLRWRCNSYNPLVYLYSTYALARGHKP